MTRRAAMVAMALLSVASSRAASPSQLDDAIRRGVAALYARQKDGHWEATPTRPAEQKNTDSPGGQWGGTTAMSVFALLCAGEDSRDEKLSAAIAFLRKADIAGTYAIGMRAQMWNRLPRSDENKAALLKDANILMKSMIQTGSGKGLYGEQAGMTKPNMAASQYGVLGMWAASEMLANVPDTYWKAAEVGFLSKQQPQGGWALFGEPSGPFVVNPTVTAAGIASLLAVQENLYENAGLDCRGNATNAGLTAVDKAITYLATALPGMTGGTAPDGFQNPTAYTTRPAYALYNIERLAAAGGLRYLGPHDWYKLGSDFLLSKQRSDGSWGTTAETSFALVFLASGRSPVMMSKLKYASTGDKPPPANWNERPRDVANVARWVARQTERQLNWQVVDLTAATARDLGEAPIAYLAGNGKLSLSADDKAKLKTFVEAGGLIVANADCGAKPFAASIRELSAELFPQYELRPLPPTHPILSGEQFVTKPTDKTKLEILGLSNGVRELIVLLPTADVGRQWQRRDLAKKESFELAANLYLYAIEKTQAFTRGESSIVTPDPKVAATRSVAVARIKTAGNWDPEPGGWRRLAALLHNRDRVDLSLVTVDLATQDFPADIKLAHWTGTAAVSLTPAARAKLKAFVDRGGTVLVDAAGGNAAFADNAERELAQLIGPAAIKPLAEPLPASHPLFGPGKAEIAYRVFARANRNLENAVPRLRGVSINERLAVVFSPDDLSAGLSAATSDGIVGYTPASATSIVRQLVLDLPK